MAHHQPVSHSAQSQIETITAEIQALHKAISKVNKLIDAVEREIARLLN